MIKYNNSNINDWYYDTSDIIKVYRNNAVCYYKIVTSGDTPTQVPCYAVVDNISQYSDTEFVDVYNKANSKWYKLNNLNQYEEYGVYGSGRTITYYEGKLTIDGSNEYQYSGGTWNNVGEVSGSTATLPNVPFSLNYNARQYDSSTNKIPQTDGQLQNVDAVRNYGSGVVDHSADGYISITSNTRFICSGNSGTYLNRTNTQTGCTMTIVSKAKATSGYSILTNRQGNGTTHLNWMYRQYSQGYMKLHGQTDTQQIVCSTTEPNILSVRTLYNSGIKSYMNNWSLGTSTSQATFAYLNTGTLGGALFCDYSDVNSEFWQGDFYWVYMSQNVLTDEQIQQVIEYNESSGGTVEYPIYYNEKSAPPNNVTFSSMTEAEEYECPWVGMQATIDGVKYIFSGDSTSGYEWVEKPSILPSGYTEVEYIQNTGTSYLNIAFTPNQDTRIVCDMQLVTLTNYPRLWGAGAYNNAAGIQPNYEGGYLQMSWFGKTSWTKYTSVQTNYNRHTYDVNKNYLYIDEVLIGSNTYTTQTASDPIGVFTYIGSGRPSSSQYWGTEHFKGKMYVFQVYDNGTLVRDLVPCIRDNDSKVGAYDIVNDVFYTVPTGYTTDQLVAGPSV